MRFIVAMLAIVLALAACDRTDPMVDAAAPATHLGGCILLSPTGEIPGDVYTRGELAATTSIPPFSKELQVYGLRLAARDEISDEFMQLVAQAITEVFPKDPDLDLDMQRKVIENHYRYRALIPVPLGDDFSFMEENEEQWADLESQYSICDIIMQAVPSGQVMEVVEHILHYVTDIGLHHAYPDVWGISDSSLLAKAMQKSIDEGYYDVSGYDDIDDSHIRFRVEMQEFAYWFISTAWNLQEPYGPVNEQEWMIRNKQELSEKLPELYAAYEQTAARVMAAPLAETLMKIGPTRAEESAQ